jgi:ribosome recycling factor
MNDLQAKIIVRKHRKDAMDLAKKHKLSKDEERRFDIKVQGVTDDFCKKIDAAYNLKVKEIHS